MRTVDPARGEMILESAARLFHRRRYDEVRMDDVAAEARVAKGTIYNYFQDKEELYVALIVSSLKRFTDEIGPLMAESAPAHDRLRTYVRKSFCFCDRFPYFIDLVQRVEGTIDPKKLAPLHEARRTIVRLLSGVIDDLNREGVYQTAHPEIAAISLTGMLRQIVRFLPKPWPKDLPEILTDQFLNGLTTPKKPRRKA